MFDSPDVPCGLASAALKIETIDDVDHRVAHVTCKVEPFTPDLALELGSTVYHHLFTDDPERAGVPMPRHEITEVGFSLPIGLQMIQARSHPDLKVEHTLRRVKVTRVRVSRPDPDKPRLTLAFVLSVELGERATMDWLVRAFGRVQHFTFVDEQMALLPGEMGPRETSREYAARSFNARVAADGGSASVKVGNEWKPANVANVDQALALARSGANTTACIHGVDVAEDTCEACEAQAQADTAAVVNDLHERRAVTPADVQAVAAQRGRAARAAKKRGRS